MDMSLEKLKELSEPEIDKAVDSASTLMIVLELAGIAIVYALLRILVGLPYADCWMVAVVAFHVCKNAQSAANEMKTRLKEQIASIKRKEAFESATEKGIEDAKKTKD